MADFILILRKSMFSINLYKRHFINNPSVINSPIEKQSKMRVLGPYLTLRSQYLHPC